MEDCAVQGASPPTIEEIDKKLSDIKGALNYQFKEEDVDKVLSLGFSVVFASELFTSSN